MRWLFLQLAMIVFLSSFVSAQVPQNFGGSLNLQALNPQISLNGLFSTAYFSEPDHLNFGGHDPQGTGFTLQNLELTLGAVVDPYVRADAHIIYLLEDGETVIEIEEAYLTTLTLPYRLQLIAGQFFTRFGLQISGPRVP